MTGLRLHNCFLAHCGKDWTLDKTWRDITMWFMVSGNISLMREDLPLNLEAGELIFLEPNTRYTSSDVLKSPFSVIVGHFDLEAEPMPFEMGRSYRIFDLVFARNLIGRVMENLGRGEEEKAKLWFSAFLADLPVSEGVSRKQSSGGVFLTLDQRRAIDEICREIRGAIHLHHGLETLASRVHVSVDHFTRLFKAQVGIPPKEYMINLRIQHAKGLLLSTSYSLAEIAEMCAYQNVYYFSRQFKQKVGVAPSRYRRSSGWETP